MPVGSGERVEGRGGQCRRHWGTHRKSRMPVLAMAYARPRMPLPMMALLRLNTDIPNEVFPSNCRNRWGERGH